VAKGDEPADIVLTNARVVDVFSGKEINAEVAIAEGHIAGIGEYPRAFSEIDLKGRFVAPAYIDAHIHLESTLLTPAEFARVVLPHGTTATVSDPHEIANVLGVLGINLMLELTEGLPFDFYFTLSSCVPATHMETAGARLFASDIDPLFSHKRIVGLAEMMNFPGVIFRDPSVMDKLELAHGRDKIIDGHSPLLTGNALNAYIAGGIRSDHECTKLDEAKEKLSKGMWVFLREGTTEKNLLELLPLVNDFTMSRLCIVSDDKHPTDLMEEGHINSSVYLAVKNGLSPFTAIRMASLNPATYFRLDFRGAIAPGYIADIQVLDNLERGLLKPVAVFKSGRLVAEEGRLTVDFPSPPIPDWALRTVKVERKIEPKDLTVTRSSSRVRVIRIIPGQIVTDYEEVEVSSGASVVSQPEADLLKLVVLERYTGKGLFSVGFVRGLGLKRGAIGSSVAHDSHNLICAGVSDEDIAFALNELIRLNGGFVAVNQGKLCGALPLPLAGLMSVESASETARKLHVLLESVRDFLGSNLHNPFMALSFLALPVIPKLKLTDKGLVDVDKFDFVSLFV